jgi:hypothetical protein
MRDGRLRFNLLLGELLNSLNSARRGVRKDPLLDLEQQNWRTVDFVQLEVLLQCLQALLYV